MKPQKLWPLAGIICCIGFAANGVLAGDPSDAGAGQHVFYLGGERLVVLRFLVYIDGRPAQQVWDEFVMHHFEEVDANTDGALDKEEQRDLPNAQLLVQLGLVGRSDQASNMMLDVSPRDGKVSRDELTAWLTRMGIEPFRVNIQQAGENRATAAQVVRRTAADEAPKVLFEKLDTDGDGALLPEDFQQALHTLRRVDLDRDEAISANELVQTANFFVAAAMVGGRNQPPKPDFIALGAGQSPRQIAQQLLAARDGQRGGMKDHRLTAAELGMEAPALAASDLDGDGALDFEEIQQFLTQPSTDVDLLVRLGKRTPGEPLLEFAGERKGRVGQDVASLMLGKVQMEFSAQSASIDFKRSMPSMFKAADRDKNGYLEANEARSLGLNTQAFALLDSDQNQKLFEEDYLRALLPLASLQHARVELNITDGGRDLFRILDANDDGRLGPRDFEAGPVHMSHWDSNRDGKLQAAEIPQQFRLAVARGALSPSGRIVTSPASVSTARTSTARPASGPDWFTKMDRNTDGDVSQLEFLGPPDVFRKLDKDSNNLVDAGEASQL